MIRKQLIETLQLSEQQLKEEVILVRHPKYQELFFLLLNKKANTFTPTFVRAIHSKLDIVEYNPGLTCLITTSLHPNIFSAGMDLNFLAPLVHYDRTSFTLEFIRLLGRILAFNVPTVGLVNGHAIAGGCMLAFAHDWRTSRAEVGKANFALNEIEIAMYIPPGMGAVVQQKVKHSTYRDMVLTAKRFDSATEGVKEGLLEFVAREEDLLAKTIEFALKLTPFSVDKDNHQRIKEEMNKVAINACLNNQLTPGVRAEFCPPLTKYGLPKPKL